MSSQNSQSVKDSIKIGRNTFDNKTYEPDFPDENKGEKVSNSIDKNPNDKKNEAKEEESDRGHWGGSAEFVLSCLGYAVGLGNVWRFPYLVYRNGGGAFLIPFILMLIFVGLPCFFLEMIVGQYSGRGPVHLWSLAPIFKGVGFGMVVINLLGSINYNVIISWSFYYLFASWQKVLPWSGCNHDFNTANCYTSLDAEPCENLYNVTNTYLSNTTFLITNNISGMINQTFTSSTKQIEDFWWYNNTCYSSTLCLTNDGTLGCNKTYVFDSRSSASQEYYKRRMLRATETLDESGVLHWERVLVLLFSWIVVWLCVIKGIKSAGKVVYFTAIFPYIILFILLIRGAMLEGSLNGVIYYLRPRWETLKNARVWVDAAGQVFFSLSVGAGGLMTFASYNKFNNNIYRDTLIVIVLDAVTSIIAGFPIFSIIGHLAFKLNKDVDNVVDSGPGLAFVVYPEMVTYLPVSQLWATLFFVMLILLGIDSQMASIETIMTAITDTFLSLRKWKPLVAGVICLCLFFMGFTMCLQSAEYWVNIMNTYPAGWSLILIALSELIVFSWFYGARRVMNNLEEMTGVELWIHWWIVFKFVAPLLLLAILVFSFVDFKPLKYSNDKDYPVWSQVIGLLMALLSVIFIPIVAVHVVYKSYSQVEYDGLTFGKRLLALTRPSTEWMPSTEKARFEAEQAAYNQNH